MENLPLYGNVRELSNIIERTAILCEKPSIDETLLRETIDSSTLTAAARVLGIDPSTLWRKMKKYQLT